MLNKRTRLLKEGVENNGPVIYWMSREQRVRDNWALLFAQDLAISKKRPLAVVFCLVSRFLGASLRQFDFMIKGLEECSIELQKKNIPFVLLRGLPEEKIIKFINKVDASILITDFDPLKIKREWKQKIIDKISIPFYEVDAHNIVPIWVASDKQEFAAYTLRPKIMKQIDNFLTDYPELKKHPFNLSFEKEEYNWDEIIKHLPVNRSISKIEWILPGEKQAKKVLLDFISNKLKNYDDFRNDPNENAQSNLSPYLHFGQISSQRVAYEIKKLPINNKSKDSFLEELIVRKELSDNYCYYCNDYDNFNGFPEWAKKTLDEHRKDKREYVYSLSIFEEARTHDNLWNAAQIEMITTGKMHGYMRMYWAKKILEWTNSPEEAQEIAIYLNDKYELDGRDPNGYTGIAWSIGGVHDRAWFSKQVYGKVRYMSYNGCKNKFDINAYIKKYNKV